MPFRDDFAGAAGRRYTVRERCRAGGPPAHADTLGDHMPIYEFRCGRCQKVTSVFTRKMNTAVAATCEHCGGSDMARMMSTFAFQRSVNDLYDDPFGDDGFGEPPDESDPKAMAEWARRMGDRMGGDMGPEFDGMLDGMAAGDGGDFDDDGVF